MRYDFIDAARDLLRGIPGYPNLSLLELGCGDGNLLEKIQADGTNVRGTTFRKQCDDYIRGREYPASLVVEEGVDLNLRLPYEDESFDVVYSTEVIEHLECHRMFVSEQARVLRPGGWLVMTTPNVHRLLSRIHFALSGVHLIKAPVITSSSPLDRMEEFHHHCVDFVLLHWLLWQSGFRIDSIIPGYIHPLSRLLMVLSPIVRRQTRPAVNRYYPAADPLEESRRDLIRWMNSSVLLKAEHICVRASKVGSSVLTSQRQASAQVDRAASS